MKFNVEDWRAIALDTQIAISQSECNIKDWCMRSICLNKKYANVLVLFVLILSSCFDAIWTCRNFELVHFKLTFTFILQVETLTVEATSTTTIKGKLDLLKVLSIRPFVSWGLCGLNKVPYKGNLKSKGACWRRKWNEFCLEKLCWQTLS
jgi:hypothetical protein